MNFQKTAFYGQELDSIDEFIATNKSNYGCYRDALLDIPGVKLLTYSDEDDGNYQYIVLEVDSDKIGISRDNLVKLLQAENVVARRYFYPGCHKMEPYCSLASNSSLSFPETDRLARSVIVFPTGTAVSVLDVKKICSILSFAVKNGSEISEQFLMSSDFIDSVPCG